jgi:hypothetical protein
MHPLYFKVLVEYASQLEREKLFKDIFMRH